MGEGLARSANFLFFANMVNNFKVEQPEGQPKPTTQPCEGMTSGPTDFSVKMTPRNK
jgi:hypothetical protein